MEQEKYESLRRYLGFTNANGATSNNNNNINDAGVHNEKEKKKGGKNVKGCGETIKMVTGAEGAQSSST